jgi:nucleoside-diphosphate-sugar epimerase
MQLDFAGKNVLVTGGTGFIGGRLVEKLVLDCHADVRVLVSHLARAFRVARFPVEIIHGDVTELSDVERAVRGCEVVFHCAYGNQGDNKRRRLVNVVGTKNVLAAALRAKTKRVVHLSTVLVYGFAKTDGDLDESAPKRYSKNVYSDSKLAAEKFALHYAQTHKLPVVVIQPTEVYGPFGTAWTLNVLQQLKAGKVILVNGGDGLCNAVYVDDVVSAILLAAVKEEAVGQAFLISGEQPGTWREFYNRFELMLGNSATVSMSKAEAKSYRRKARGIVQETLSVLREEPRVLERLLQTREAAYLKQIGFSLLPERSWHYLKEKILNGGKTDQQQRVPKINNLIHPLNSLMVDFYAAKTRIRIDKAKKLLGYQPVFDFESGMKLTEQWARWANLL